MSDPGSNVEHRHWCDVCGAYWTHDCAEDECDCGNALTQVPTDMRCPMHDGLPNHERE